MHKQPYIHTIRQNIYILLLLVIALLMVISTIRIHEAFILVGKGLEHLKPWSHFGNGISYDFKAVIILATCSLPLIFSKGIFKSVFGSLCLIFLVVNISLGQYFLTNVQLLGVEILIFPKDELLHIVGNELVSYELIDYVYILLYPSLFVLLSFLVFKLSKEVSKIKFVISIVIILTLMSVVWIEYAYLFPRRSKYDSQGEYFMANNKTAYFLTSLYEKQEEYRNSKINIKTIYRGIDSYQDRKKLNFIDPKYPFLWSLSKKDNVLGQYFTNDTVAPNVVFVLVESLSRSFSGPNAHLGSLTPFLDSLRLKSLYWENFFSNCDHTYGVLPNTLGSLPKGPGSFMNVIPYPNHSSLLSELKLNGYNSNFYYGAWGDFNNTKPFLNSEGVDFVLDMGNFDSTRFSIPKKKNKDFVWGYVDKDLMTHSFDYVSKQKTPYFNTYLTVTMHSPYDVSENFTLQDAKNRLRTAGQDSNRLFDKQPEVIKAIAYDDYVFEYFFNEYKKRPEFENTIFVITGDHNIHTLPTTNELDIFHVPLIIYSPLLQGAHSFKGVSTHHDIYPSLSALLKYNYSIEMDSIINAMGSGLDTSSKFRCNKIDEFTLGSDKYLNYMSGKYVCTNKETYEIDSTLGLISTDKYTSDSIIKEKNELIMLENYIFKFNKLNYRKRSLQE